MAIERLYRPEHVGDWGTPVTVAGGTYETGSFARPDGVSLFFRAWRQPDTAAPTLALLHGLGAHSGWFIDMGNALHTRGLTVYAVDHRGFGRSSGPRGHVRDATLFIADLLAWLDDVSRRQPGAPLFALGHSMGGLFLLNVAARDARRKSPALSGIILLNPWIRDTTKTSLGTTLTVLGGGLFGSRYVAPATAGSDTSTMTTQPDAVRLLQEDTYWVRARSSSFLYQVAGVMRPQALRRAREVRAPALVVQCEGDRAVVQAATRQCFQTLGSHDKLFQSFPAFEHDCEFEAERGPLDDAIAAWIARHSA